MTPQEQQMIDGLIGRVRSTQVQNKDAEAEQHIQQGLAGYPDALYVLVQTVLVQQYGLEQAQSQIDALKQQANTQSDSQPRGGSFLSHIFGGGSGSGPGTSPAVRSGNAQPPYTPVNNPAYGNQGYPPPPPVYPAGGYGGGMFGGGGGGFLRGALQTAAGVAAGEMMFQGMEDLFHGFGGGSHRAFGDSDSPAMNSDRFDNNQDISSADKNTQDSSDGSFYNPSDDASRSDLTDNTGDNAAAFANTSDNGQGLDSGDTFGDSGGFDDSGSFDGSGDFGGGDFSGDNS